jgi:hypothetical protein
MSRLRPDVSSLSRLTKTHRLLIVTLISVFVLSGLALSTSAALRAKLGLAKASRPEVVQQPQVKNRTRKETRMGNGLLRFAGIDHTERTVGLPPPLAPTVTATKVDSLFADADSDGQADPGDTIKYTVNINASGSDATGVTFTDTVDPNTTFVPGTLTATPVAVNDTYSALGNVRISIAAPGVLGNDFTGLPSATITSPPSTSANGGDVTLNADGSFTYNPPAGFEGADTFTYTLTSTAGSNSATVTINVSGMIWFIDNNASCPCDGRLTKPFNTIASFAAVNNGTGNNPAANDNIFIYESASSYSATLTLLNGQKLIGQDASASLSSITGLTPPTGSDPLPTTNSANATIVNIQSGGTSITVGQNNTLTGFTGGSSVTDISGSGFGTLTISDVTLNGIGQALDLTNGTLAATFLSISSSNSTTTGISLTGVAGSLTSPTTSIANPTGSALSVDTSSGSLNFGNTSATGSGGTGISLTTNTGTITFGSLSISPTTGQRALLATDNTNTITATSGAVTTTSATAVEITRASSSTPLAISLTSVSATASAPNGIYLKNTSGSFTVNGDGANTSVGGNGTGGNIANTVGADGAVAGNGVYLDNAGNVTLRRMTINGTNQNDGIRGVNGNSGFTLEYSTVNGTNGNNAALDEGSVIFNDLLGTSSFRNDSIGGSVEDNFRIRNASGVADVTVTGSSFTNAPNDNLTIEPSGTSNVAAHITNNTFTGAGGDHFQAATTNSATLALFFSGNLYSNGFPSSLGGGITISGGNAGSSESVSFNISNNGTAGSPLVGSVAGGAININKGAGNGTWQGQVSNNFIGNAGVANSGASQGSAIRVENHAPSGSLTAIISGNTLKQWNNGPAINTQDGDAGNASNAGVLNLTVTNNTASNPGVNAQHGFIANIGASGSLADVSVACTDVRSNVLDGNVATGGVGIRLRHRGSSNVKIPGYTGAQYDTTAVANFEIAQNPGNTANAATSSSGPGFTNTSPANSQCTQPVFPLAMFSNPLAQKSAFGVRAHHAQSGGSGNGSDIGTLRVDRGESTDPNTGQSLTQALVDSAVQAALDRWHNAGVSDDDLLRLRAVTFEISDLPESQLATTSSTNVKLDETAAGYGWYVDPTPAEDSEFSVAVPQRELQANEYSAAFGHIDLLTVIMRELGVVYLQSNSSTPDRMQALMQGTLTLSTRRLPDSQAIVLPAATAKAVLTNSRTTVATGAGTQVRPQALASRIADRQSTRLMSHSVRARTATGPMTFADVSLNIGTLPAGKSVTITFNATVNNPFTGSLAQVSNQGTVSGSNFSNVLTDDPDVGGAADPTVTPIDLPKVSVAVSPAAVAEDGPTNLVYTFTRTGPTTSPMTVNFNVGGTASFTQPDYTQSGAATFTATSGTVTIPAGSSSAAVTIDPTADTTVEPDETVVLTVTSGSGYTPGSPSSATGTITNDDTDVSVAVSPAAVAEDGPTNLVYTFTRVGVTSTPLTVNFNVGGTATFGVSPDDYTQSGATSFTASAGTVSFAAGSSTATVIVDPEADTVVEPDETVVLTLASGAGYNVASPAAATGTILNDDSSVSVAVSPASVAEDGATNLVYTFTRAGVTTSPLTVNFSVGGTATFGASPNDYTQSGATSFTTSAGSVTIPAGSSTATVTIDPEADTTVEPDETVDLTVTAGSGYTVGLPSSAVGTITNDDTDVTVAVSPASVTEDGPTNLVYTFTRAGVTSNSLTVNFSVGGTATFGASPNDYTESGAASFTASSGSVTFAPGSSTASVTVDPEADTTVEPDETVDLTLTPGSGYNVASPSSASGTILNDDTDVSVAVSPAAVLEDGPTNLVYTFTRNGVTSNSLTVHFSVGGTATFGASPNDYTESGATSFTSSSGTVTFAPGSSTATVTVDPEADNTIEPDETVVLTLTAGTGYNVSSPSSATGTILNDDADVSVAVSPAAVPEDGPTNMVYTFTRTGYTGGSLTVNFTVGGTATFGPSPNDYTVSGATTFTATNGSVTFAPGSSTATVTVDPEADSIPEPDETVIITLASGTSYNAVNPNSATGTILNDDTLVSVAVSPTATVEGGANLVYTFTRTGPTTSPVTVSFTVGGSATFPADYTETGAATFAPPAATVTIPVGSSSATVNVTPLTDCVVEGDETVDFTVQPGTGYGVGSPSTASGTIANTPDTTAPTITLIPNVNMTLWPPDHRYVSVSVTDFVASASDNCDPSVNLSSVYILKITSDEAENGNGDGNTLNDIVIGGDCRTAQLRAERSGNGDGRVYTITFKVQDSAGNFTTATATVTVPKSPNVPAVDSGPVYTVNSACP